MIKSICAKQGFDRLASLLVDTYLGTYGVPSNNFFTLFEIGNLYESENVIMGSLMERIRLICYVRLPMTTFSDS